MSNQCIKKFKIKIMKTKTLLTIILLFTLSFELFAQSGISWNATINVNNMSMYGNLHPKITMDRSGDPMIIWGKTSNTAAYFSKWNGTSFTTPVIVNTTIPVFTASWAGPDIASNDDTVYVVVKETPEMMNPAYIFSSFDGGNTFSDTIRLDTYRADSISRFPTVTVDNAGNPIVGYMKINSDFTTARWVVTRSNDYGATFNVDVKGSGWSGGDVCDCCPATITNSGNTVAIMYRDENSNIRDMWTGVSTDNGNTFNNGMALDSPLWMLMACPSSGPNGVIIGDKLYSVLMSGYTGNYLTYFSESTISSLSNDTVYPLTGMMAGLTTQNYPRIATDGSAVGIVWKQTVSGESQLPLLFTNNINNGFPAQYDTIDLGDITNADIAIYNGNIHIVWQDDISGTVKYRSGTFSSTMGIDNISEDNILQVYPNPVMSVMNVQLKNNFTGSAEITITDVLGKTVQRRSVNINNGDMGIDVSGFTNGVYMIEVIAGSQKFASRFVKE